MRLLMLFVLLPLIELFLLLKLADAISGGWTFALVIGTGIVGATLARRQGWGVMQRINQELAANQLPTRSLVDAMMIFVAGALLITPGILTDIVGFSLLIPYCRRFYQAAVLHAFRNHVHFHSNVTVFQQTSTPSQPAPSADGDVIDSYVVSRSETEERP